jgi:hypothetical protein
MLQNFHRFRTSGTEVITSASGFLIQDAVKLSCSYRQNWSKFVRTRLYLCKKNRAGGHF